MEKGERVIPENKLITAIARKAKAGMIHLEDLLATIADVPSAEAVDFLTWHIARLKTRSCGGDREFNERQKAYEASSFCAGYDYALSLMSGILSQIR